MLGNKLKTVEYLAGAMGRKRVIVDGNTILDENTYAPLTSSLLASTFNYKFISGNSNMAIFLNENNLYDISVDGAKFSATQTLLQKTPPEDPAKPLSKLPGPAGVFDSDPFSFGGPPAHQAQPFQYENPDKIFGNNSGVGDFKFNGFGKDAWGIYSAGSDAQPQQAPGFVATAEAFSGPFEKQDKAFEAFGSDFKAGPGQGSEAKDAIWSAKEGPAGQGSEEVRKENKKSLL